MTRNDFHAHVGKNESLIFKIYMGFSWYPSVLTLLSSSIFYYLIYTLVSKLLKIKV